MKNLTFLLSEYGESHTNSINKTIHFVCVPAIFWSVCALLHMVKWNSHSFVGLNGLDLPVLAFVLMYYFLLSPVLSFGFVVLGAGCITLSAFIEIQGWSLLIVALIVFSTAWIGQRLEHRIEGKKHSFLKDLQFLLIGPAWIMAFIYQKLGFNLETDGLKSAKNP